MNFNLPSILILASSLASSALSVYAWKRRRNRAVMPLFYILVAAAWWSFFYGLVLSLTELPVISTLTALSYIGIASIGVLWLIFAASYTGSDSWLSRRNSALLFIMPAVSVFSAVSNPIHRMFYSSFDLVVVEGIYFQKLEYGPLWWVHSVYSYLALSAGMLFFIRMFFRVTGNDRLRVSFFLAGGMLPYAVSIAYIFGFRPYGFLDITPVAFMATGLILTVGIFFIKIFDITPLALDVLFHNMPDAIFVVDQNGLIVNSNQGGEELIKSEDFKISGYCREAASGAAGNTELEVGGRILESTVSPVSGARGACLGTLVVMRDITEKKESEKRMLESVAAKEDFVTSVSHELRTPLSIIRESVSVLQDGLLGPLNSGQSRILSTINNNIERLVRLITEVLTFRSIKEGESGLSKSIGDINMLVRQTAGMFKNKAEAKGLSVTLDLGEDIRPFYFDADRITQVLVNLIGNALKFTDEGSISLKTVLLPGGECEVSVSDTGAGVGDIPEEKLFAVFVQGSSQAKSKPSGFGLGLAISKQLVEMHGGSIGLRRNPGKGATFFFRLPASDENNRAQGENHLGGAGEKQNV